jgi:hypothetical protein
MSRLGRNRRRRCMFHFFLSITTLLDNSGKAQVPVWRYLMRIRREPFTRETDPRIAARPNRAPVKGRTSRGRLVFPPATRSDMHTWVLNQTTQPVFRPCALCYSQT